MSHHKANQVLRAGLTICVIVLIGWYANAQSAPPPAGPAPIVLRTTQLLDIRAGRVDGPAEVLVEGERIIEIGVQVRHPPGARIIDLGSRSVLPGLIDAHVHLFLHPGAEDLQTVEESVPQRVIMATLAARDDLPPCAARNVRKALACLWQATNDLDLQFEQLYDLGV